MEKDVRYFAYGSCMDEESFRSTVGEKNYEVLGRAILPGYRLAFTLPPAELAELQARFPDIAVIGRVEAGEGVHLHDEQGEACLPSQRGYQHFG